MIKDWDFGLILKIGDLRLPTTPKNAPSSGRFALKGNRVETEPAVEGKAVGAGREVIRGQTGAEFVKLEKMLRRRGKTRHAAIIGYIFDFKEKNV